MAVVASGFSRTEQLRCIAFPERRVTVDRHALPLFSAAIRPDDAYPGRRARVAEPGEHARIAGRGVTPVSSRPPPQRQAVGACDFHACAHGVAPTLAEL